MLHQNFSFCSSWQEDWNAPLYHGRLFALPFPPITFLFCFTSLLSPFFLSFFFLSSFFSLLSYLYSLIPSPFSLLFSLLILSSFLLSLYSHLNFLLSSLISSPYTLSNFFSKMRRTFLTTRCACFFSIYNKLQFTTKKT